MPRPATCPVSPSQGTITQLRDTEVPREELARGLGDCRNSGIFILYSPRSQIKGGDIRKFQGWRHPHLTKWPKRKQGSEPQKLIRNPYLPC